MSVFLSVDLSVTVGDVGEFWRISQRQRRHEITMKALLRLAFRLINTQKAARGHFPCLPMNGRFLMHENMLSHQKEK